MKTDEILPGHLILSVNRAILKEVTSNMRSVSVIQADKTLFVRFVFYAPPSEDETEAMGYIGTEVIADFPAMDMQFEEHDVIPTGRIERKPNEHIVFERKPEEPSSG